MMPHLGVLAEISERAATEVFDKDCIVYLGTCVATVGKCKYGKTALSAEINLPDGSTFKEDIPFGEVRLIPCGAGETAKAVLKPQHGLDIGEGKNQEVQADLHGGVVGIVLDTRGRQPFDLPDDKDERVSKLKKWMSEFKAYPETILK
jgi:hypothetical protein